MTALIGTDTFMKVFERVQRENARHCIELLRRGERPKLTKIGTEFKGRNAVTIGGESI